MRRLIEVGPFAIFFTNQNLEMGLRAHSHYGRVTVVYRVIGRHGFPSLDTPNRALEARIHELTEVVFKDATNEDVVSKIFGHLNGYIAPEWQEWGGGYALHAIHLDVYGVRDRIGHDASTTRYSVIND